MFNALTGNILLLLFCLVTITAAAFHVHKKDLKSISSILFPVTGAFIVRVIIALLFVYVITLPARYTSDQSLYDEYSSILSAHKNIRTFPPPRISRFTSKASLFSGAQPFAFRLVIITVSILGLLSVFNIFKKLYKKIHPAVFWVPALFPSLILWQTFHLKDGLLTALAALFVFGIINFFIAKEKIFSGLLAGASLAGVFLMRPYWAVCLAAAAGAAVLQYFLSNSFPKFRWSLPCAGAVFTILAASFFIARPLDIIQMIHNNMTVGAATMIYPDLHFNSIMDVLLYVPKGAAAFLFMPWPWAAQPTLFHSLTSLDSLLCLLLIPAGLIELIYLAVISKEKNTQSISTIMLTLMFSLIFFHSIIEGNVGTAFRHRMIIIQFMIIPGIFLLNRIFNFFQLCPDCKTINSMK